MKKITLIILITSLKLNAAIINLKSGETVNIQSNQNSTVTCDAGSSPSDCKARVDRFTKRFDLCLASYSTEQCINTVWADFKKANPPQCVDEASDYCLQKCNDSMSTDWCLNKCK